MSNYHKQDSEKFVVGSGELYLGKINNPETASEEEIVSALKNVGAIEAGATLSYTPTIIDIEAANRGLIDRIVTREEVTFNCGIMTWLIDNLAVLSPASIDVDEITGVKKVKIGGKTKLPVNYLRFLHEKKDGSGELIVNIAKAQSVNGFSLDFNKDNATSINYEFSALSDKSGNLVEIIETFTNVE
ncbi:hypothetical protein EDC18_102423 [Natranaerovirga pectinivora]|uniref:Uncharacterized protein n=1 Tax=Natranaerovirga pectinivora TaxID=682400 RepID=A0A4R3MTL0_9FIRM|nr:hypothetical protein [Natranaerovirga pectinivora]TCT16404.1 hypothetical protein EDC18_102423 [Natranaerovirga pectinivora]